MTIKKLYQTAPYVRLGFRQNTLLLGFGSLQLQIGDPQEQKLLIEMLHCWRQPSPVSAIQNEFKKNGFANQKITRAAQKLLASHFLIEHGLYDASDRFSRSFLFYALSGANPIEVQKKLRQCHVIILGCGGIGNLVASILATSGVGKLTLVDNDSIELSNLTRQLLFTEDDVHQKKADVLRRELKRRISNIQIDTIQEEIRDQNSLGRLPLSDLMLVSADKHGIVCLANRYCVQTRTPFTNIGYVQDVAVWGPFVVPGITGCYECQNLVSRKCCEDQQLSQMINEINAGYQAPSIGPINMLAAACASLDILRYLGGFGTVLTLSKRIGLWSHSLKVETQECKRNKRCQICGQL